MITWDTACVQTNQYSLCFAEYSTLECVNIKSYAHLRTTEDSHCVRPCSCWLLTSGCLRNPGPIEKCRANKREKETHRKSTTNCVTFPSRRVPSCVLEDRSFADSFLCKSSVIRRHRISQADLFDRDCFSASWKICVMVDRTRYVEDPYGVL